MSSPTRNGPKQKQQINEVQKTKSSKGVQNLIRKKIDFFFFFKKVHQLQPHPVTPRHLRLTEKEQKRQRMREMAKQRERNGEREG